MSSVHETHSTFQYTQRSNSEEERLAKLHRILHSLATRIPRVLLKRVEEVYPALNLNVKENSGPGSTLVSNAECETEEHKCVPKNFTQRVESEPENRNEESRSFDKCRKIKRELQKCKKDRRYSCDFCNKKLTKHYLKRHMLYHTGSLPYTCTVCSRQFPFNSNLRLHYQRKHRMK